MIYQDMNFYKKPKIQSSKLYSLKDNKRAALKIPILLNPKILKKERHSQNKNSLLIAKFLYIVRREAIFHLNNSIVKIIHTFLLRKLI